MNFETFLSRVIKEGIEAAKGDYTRLDQKTKLKGSIAGFEACRGKSPIELGKLLKEADAKTTAHMREERDDVEGYWEVRCFAAGVEWVCNVVSSALVNQGLPEIIPPTARGVMKAASIIGVGSFSLN